MVLVVVLGRNVLPCENMVVLALSDQHPPTQAAKQPEQHKHNNRPANHERLKKIRIKKNHQLRTEIKTRQLRLN